MSVTGGVYSSGSLHWRAINQPDILNKVWSNGLALESQFSVILASTAGG